MKTLRSTITALLLTAIYVGVAEACPTCKEAVAENGGNLVRGYFWSIIFMMSMPFLILSALSAMFYLDVLRARRVKAMGEGFAFETNAQPVGSV